MSEQESKKCSSTFRDEYCYLDCKLQKDHPLPHEAEVRKTIRWD